ncbi:hypothetical protein C2S53_015678 [Perilla frutescens var. hirtella]|uniref:Uncharacterized protein n=1 Tax=Perilla frutescens var. hirtella TaxID=608512 RepID=A0AAD4P6X9_PERFH|nr:hypothetical protein C2S53_015678 [Perilla frutescens var. hirtella]
MGDRNTSPASSSSSGTVGRCQRRHWVEEGGGEAACTGMSCQSCTAGVIADCVAVCCCPCAVVNILTLAFVKLPWAVARRCLARRKRRMVEEERRKRGGGGSGGGDRDGIWENGVGTSEIVVSIGEELNDHFSAEFKGEEDVWLELYELGHLGFGRVSFTGIPFQNKGD